MSLSCVGYINVRAPLVERVFLMMLALPFNNDLCVMMLLANLALGIFLLHNLYTASCIKVGDLQYVQKVIQ